MGASIKNYIKKNWRHLFTFACLVLLILMTWLAFGNAVKTFPPLFRLLQKGDEHQIAAYLERQGQWRGILVIVLFSIIQVISIVIPGMAIQVAAGLIYGWWKAFFMCYFGFVAGNCLVFIFARQVGDRLTRHFTSRNKDSWIMGKINSGRPEFVFGMACLIPGIPNGIIPYIAASSKVRSVGFGVAVAASSWLQILLNCLAGAFLMRGQYLFVVLSFAAQILLIVVMFLKRDWFLSKF
jgi:uncharacterized membrane protein YdjX (TVP38/TMEM64 family)